MVAASPSVSVRSIARPLVASIGAWFIYRLSWIFGARTAAPMSLERDHLDAHSR